MNIAGFELANGKTQSHYLMIPIDLRYSFHALDFLDVFALAGPRFNVGLASTTTVSALGDAVYTTVVSYLHVVESYASWRASSRARMCQ